MPQSNKHKAEIFRELHHRREVLLLPNAWDPASARLLETLGFPAVATTSAGCANALGYSDGQRITGDEMLEAVRRIVQAVNVPVTADMEAGYASTAAEMYATAQALIQTGAVGLNLEDGTHDEQLTTIERQVEKISAIRQAATDLEVPLVINARTDAYWLNLYPPAEALMETIRRANAYREAGADCIFIPGLRNLGDIEAFLRVSPVPLNILCGPGSPSVKELQNAGVRRISLGSGPFRAALGVLREIARELRESGTYEAIQRYGIPYKEVNEWFERNEDSNSGKSH